MTNPQRSPASSDQPSQAGAPAAKPEPGESARAKAKEMAKAYEDRPTAVLPGSGGTVTGTAINEWLDDDGEPIYGRDAGGADPDRG